MPFFFLLFRALRSMYSFKKQRLFRHVQTIKKEFLFFIFSLTAIILPSGISLSFDLYNDAFSLKSKPLVEQRQQIWVFE